MVFADTLGNQFIITEATQYQGRGGGKAGGTTWVFFRALDYNSNAESIYLLEIKSRGGDTSMCIKQVIICHAFFLNFH